MGTLEIISRTPKMVHSLRKLVNYQLEVLVVETIKRIDINSVVDPTLHECVLATSSTGRVNPDAVMGERLRKLSEELDDEYFTLLEGGEKESLWSAKFKAARMAFALSEVSQGVRLENVADFIYEMAHGHDSPETFLEKTENLIDQIASGNAGPQT